MARLLNQTQNQVLATNVIYAHSLFQRLKGLLGTSSLGSDEAMWISHCNSIHTFFMKFAIDVVFVDRSLVVRAVHRGVRPSRIVWPTLGADSVFEFSSERSSELSVNVGDQLHVDA